MVGTNRKWKNPWNAGESDFYVGSGNHLKLVKTSSPETNNYVETTKVDSTSWVARIISNYSGEHTTSWHGQFNLAKSLSDTE